MNNRSSDDAEAFRAEVDAAGLDGHAVHFRELAENIVDVYGDGIDARIATAVNVTGAGTRHAFRDTSRAFQEAADEHRRQRGI